MYYFSFDQHYICAKQCPHKPIALYKKLSLQTLRELQEMCSSHTKTRLHSKCCCMRQKKILWFIFYQSHYNHLNSLRMTHNQGKTWRTCWWQSWAHRGGVRQWWRCCPVWTGCPSSSGSPPACHWSSSARRVTPHLPALSREAEMEERADEPKGGQLSTEQTCTNSRNINREAGIFNFTVL